MDLEACLDILKARATKAEDGSHSHHHRAPCVEENVSRTLELKAGAVQLDAEPELETMTPFELLKTFQVCQDERVQVYQRFEKGFMELMLSDRLTGFTQEITKQFASISNQVNAIEKTLRAMETIPATLPNLVRNVQNQEKEKLLLTSALLLETMRLKRTSEANPDDSSIPIFEKSIETMQSKHTLIIETINEFLQEIRYEMSEL